MPPPAAKKTLLLSENPEEQEMMLRLINGDATVLFAPNRYTPLTANELELLCQRPVQLKEQSESSQGYASSYPESSVEPDFIPNDRVEHHEMSEEVDILNDTEEIEEYQEGSEGYNEEATRETHEVYSSDDNDDYCEASPPIDPSPTLVQWKSGGNFVTPIKDHNKWVQARQYSMQPQVAALAAQPVVGQCLFETDYYWFPQSVDLPPEPEELQLQYLYKNREVKGIHIFEELREHLLDEQERQRDMRIVKLKRKYRVKKGPAKERTKVPKAPKEPKIPQKRGPKPRKSKKKKVNLWMRSTDKDYKTVEKEVRMREDSDKRARAQVFYGDFEEIFE